MTDRPAPVPGRNSGSVTGASAPRPRVLVVEDNPLNRLLLGQVVARLDLDHVAVGCAEEAMLRFAREPFDAVLIDVAMDGMTGCGLPNAMEPYAGGDAPPFLGYGSDLDPDVLEAAGFAAVIETPVDADRLCAALISALQRVPGPVPAE